MARPKRAIPNIEVKIPLPPDTLTRMDLKLYSEIEQRIPYGARSRYLTNLIEADLAKDEKK